MNLLRELREHQNGEDKMEQQAVFTRRPKRKNPYNHYDGLKCRLYQSREVYCWFIEIKTKHKEIQTLLHKVCRRLFVSVEIDANKHKQLLRSKHCKISRRRRDGGGHRVLAGGEKEVGVDQRNGMTQRRRARTHVISKRNHFSLKIIIIKMIIIIINLIP